MIQNETGESYSLTTPLRLSTLYRFWVANLAAWMYDNRGNAEAQAAIPAYILSSVHQLRPYGE